MKKRVWGPTERNGNLVIAGILWCIGLYCILASQDMPHVEYVAVPGSGFFPTILGIILCGVSLALGVGIILHRTTTNYVEIAHLHIWLIIMAIMVMGVFFERIGFIPMTWLFVASILKILSDHGWLVCAVSGAVAAISAYLFFNTLIGIHLPLGLLWF